MVAQTPGGALGSYFEFPNGSLNGNNFVNNYKLKGMYSLYYFIVFISCRLLLSHRKQLEEIF